MSQSCTYSRGTCAVITIISGHISVITYSWPLWSRSRCLDALGVAGFYRSHGFSFESCAAACQGPRLFTAMYSRGCLGQTLCPLIPLLPPMADKVWIRAAHWQLFLLEKTNSLQSMDFCYTVCAGGNNVDAVTTIKELHWSQWDTRLIWGIMKWQ